MQVAKPTGTPNAPADTGTHRSYPKSLRNASHFESGQDLDALGGTPWANTHVITFFFDNGGAQAVSTVAWSISQGCHSWKRRTFALASPVLRPKLFFCVTFT